MSDYRDVFGDDVASGLGLGRRPRVDRRKAVEEYYEDPAEAFSRAAEFMQPPGGDIPVPFAATFIPGNRK